MNRRRASLDRVFDIVGVSRDDRSVDASVAIQFRSENTGFDQENQQSEYESKFFIARKHAHIV